MDAKTFVIDIDDTLFYSEKIRCKTCQRIEYILISKNNKEIDIINKLHDQGNTIILWTGRNWDCYQATKKELEKAEIKHHELIMGKPQGIYIDKDVKTSLEEFLQIKDKNV